MQDILYLASQSLSRKKLLQAAGINFVACAHVSDELVERENMSFDAYVLAVAQEKMQSLRLPEQIQDGRGRRFILTADTLVHIVSSGMVLGKPKDRTDAENMLRAMRNEQVEVITGCCLQRQEFKNGIWHQAAHAMWTAGAMIEFDVDDDSINSYFLKEPDIIKAAGACIVDVGYGQSFFKSINGSFSAVIGLPLFELRQELKKMGFQY